MRNRLLTYAIGGSIAVHLVLLGVVGKSSAAKPIQVDQLKVVRVDLAKSPDQVAVAQDKPNQTEAPKPKVEASAPDVPYVPPVKAMPTRDQLPRGFQPRKQPVPWPKAPGTRPTSVTASAKLAGDPGGALSGIASPRGTDMGQVASGGTPMGWVPGTDIGRGSGSGSGAGVGSPNPVPDVSPGPSSEPAPAPKVEPQPVPQPAPQPKLIEVTVCAVSGMIPGSHCEKKESKSFREGSEPRGTCNVCKAPEPKFVSKLADRQEPELTKDSQPKIPAIDEPGDYVVKVRYTVNTDGSVSDVEIVDSSGISAIDRAVRDSASKMRYKPAVQNGEPRSVRITRRYRISI